MDVKLHAMDVSLESLHHNKGGSSVEAKRDMVCPNFIEMYQSLKFCPSGLGLNRRYRGFVNPDNGMLPR